MGENSQKFTRSSTFVGTVGFQPPEMIDEFSISIASDLWALGVIIFVMVTGRMPFKSNNSLSAKFVYAEIMERNIDWPSEPPMNADC